MRPPNRKPKTQNQKPPPRSHSRESALPRAAFSVVAPQGLIWDRKFYLTPTKILADRLNPLGTRGAKSVDIPINVMKTIHHLSSALIAAGSAGVAVMTVTGLVPDAVGFAVLSLLGLAGFVLFDYARTPRSLRPLAPIVRPALPGGTTPHVTRRVAAIVERAA